MTLDTFHKEIASLRDFLAFLEAEPADPLFATLVEDAARSVVFCARELLPVIASEVDKSRGVHG